MQIPRLETQRLILRGHRKEDFPALAAMWAEPAVTQFILGKPSTEEESWSRLLRYIGHWSLLGFGFWALEEKATGEFIGELGFADFHRTIDPPLGERPEVGWAIRSRSHGKGYASEALPAVFAWGEERFKARETACMIDPENAASIRIAEKFGFREVLRTTYKELPAIIYYRRPQTQTS
jgi:RimJ/RimL family protein N-acetyltransferase